MKKQLKICLLLLLFIFSSCEKEIYDDLNYTKNVINKKFISLEELKINHKAFSKFEEIKSTQEVLRTKKITSLKN